MSTDGIDAKKLKEGLAELRKMARGTTDQTWWVRDRDREAFREVIAAAEAHLSTLPREVEVEVWAVVSEDGVPGTLHYTEAQAQFAKPSGFIVVRLTGTAVLPKG